MDIHGLSLDNTDNDIVPLHPSYQSALTSRSVKDDQTVERFDQNEAKLDIWGHHVNNSRAQTINNYEERDNIAANGVRLGSNLGLFRNKLAGLPSFQSFVEDEVPDVQLEDRPDGQQQQMVPGFRGYLPRDVCHVTTTMTRKLLAQRVYTDPAGRPIEERDLRVLNMAKNLPDSMFTTPSSSFTEAPGNHVSGNHGSGNHGSGNHGNSRPPSDMQFSCQNILPPVRQQKYTVGTSSMSCERLERLRFHRSNSLPLPPEMLQGRRLFTAPEGIRPRTEKEQEKENQDEKDCGRTSHRRKHPELLARRSLLPKQSLQELTPSNIVRLTTATTFNSNGKTYMNDARSGGQNLTNLFPKFHNSFSPIQQSPSHQSLQSESSTLPPVKREAFTASMTSSSNKPISNASVIQATRCIRQGDRRRNSLMSDAKLKHYFSTNMHRRMSCSPTPPPQKSPQGGGSKQRRTSVCPNPSGRVQPQISVLLHCPSSTNDGKPQKWWQRIVKTATGSIY